LQVFIDWQEAEQSRCPAPIYCYDALRRRLDLDGTSQLSPYLRFGMLSARQVAVSALSALDAAPSAEARHSADLWLDALIWREFASSLVQQRGQARHLVQRPEWPNQTWQSEPTAFEAWAAGRTGIPLVDAAMRQLVQTGWLPDRARMITASFLAKDLLVDWRWGERFFMQHLLDGDPAASDVNWQRARGIGTGPAPYLGVPDPAIEGTTHDPEGAYVQHWVPELAHVPAPYLHQPWRMPLDIQLESGCIIGQDYPAPILDVDWAREPTVQFLSAARQPVKS
jgi:deoxyribodipyrimidine photo-lyase